MEKHTPGPWNIGEMSNNKVWAHREDGTSSCICELNNQHNQDFSRYVNCSQEEIDANAKLIASAPDIFKSLTELYNAIGSCIDLTPEVLERANKAIKKATETQ